MQVFVFLIINVFNKTEHNVLGTGGKNRKAGRAARVKRRSFEFGKFELDAKYLLEMFTLTSPIKMEYSVVSTGVFINPVASIGGK